MVCGFIQALDLGRAEATADDMMELIWLEIAKAKYAEWEQAALPRIEKVTFWFPGFCNFYGKLLKYA